MKYNAAIIIAFIFQHLASAQCDYSITKYSVASEKNILYGIANDHKNNPDSLMLDIYYPVFPLEQEMPLIIWAFGGGFFQGKRQDLANICQSIAARGIVCATIDYRLGFSGPPGYNPPYSFDANEIIRAGYRASTDMKAAIRFLKSKHNEYQIDLNRVWLGGFSAGAIVALNTAFMNKESEKPAAAGNLNAIGTLKRNDLGPVEGELNINSYDTKIQGVLNIFGAVLDTNMIEAGDDVAVFSYHQTNDPIVPCHVNTPYYQLPFLAINYPVAYGSCIISERLAHVNLDPVFWESWIYNGNQHNTHNEAEVVNFLLREAKPVMCNSITAINNKTFESTYLVPNPVQDELQIINLDKSFAYEIINSEGVIIKKSGVTSDVRIQTAALSSGLYLLKISTGGITKIHKFIKS